MNELIMRSEEELDMWQRLDEQRKEAKAGGAANQLPRLMQVSRLAPRPPACAAPSL